MVETPELAAYLNVPSASYYKRDCSHTPFWLMSCLYFAWEKMWFWLRA